MEIDKEYERLRRIRIRLDESEIECACQEYVKVLTLRSLGQLSDAQWTFEWTESKDGKLGVEFIITIREGGKPL